MSGDYRIPEGLDLEILSPESPPLLISYCYIFLTILAETAATQIDLDPSGFVRIHSGTLRKAIPVRQLAEVKRLLTSLGIIELDKGYLPGEVSKGYRLCLPWKTKPQIKRAATPKAARAVAKTRKERLCPSLPVHHDMISCFDLLTAHKDIELHVREAAIQSKIRKGRKGKSKKLEDIECSYFSKISMLRDREIFFKPDSSGRCHTNFTTFPSGLRRFLYLDGKPIVKVDVSAAQAYIFTGMYRKKKITQGKIKGNKEEKKKGNIPMLCILLSEGKFYEWWQSAGGYRTREQAKKAFVGYLNDTAGQTVYKKEDELFRRLFPELWEYRESFVGKTKDETNLLSYLLQREEAEWIIGGAFVRLRSEVAGIPLMTIHDCIGTVPEYVEVVERTIVEMGLERYGFAPHVKIDPAAVLMESAA